MTKPFLSPDTVRRLIAVLDSKSDDFFELHALVEVDPATGYRFSDFRKATFGTNGSLNGFDFSGCDLRDTDIASLDLTGLRWDDATIWPEGFTPPAREKQP